MSFNVRGAPPLRAALLGLGLLLAVDSPVLAAQKALSANALFGAVSQPTQAESPRVIGSYTRGCISGAVPLATEGPGWQVMRLSRNRNWGHPVLIDVIKRLAAAARADGLPGILVGDMAQPRGGPMRSGHASHQLGLDADIWLKPMPGHLLSPDERESISAVSVVQKGKYAVDPDRWNARQAALIRRAALFPEVERIFVNPGIKKALCATAPKDDRAWLGKVRPWYGHDAHFHIRLRCPPGEPLCEPQAPVPPGDGCRGELAWWLGQAPWTPPERDTPARPVSMAELPKACRTVLQAP